MRNRIINRQVLIYGVPGMVLAALFVAGCSVGNLVSGGVGDAPPGQIIWNDPSPPTRDNIPEDATYVGVEVCGACHGRPTKGHPEGIVAEWKKQFHAKDPTKLGGAGNIDIFTRFVADGYYPGTPCSICHVTGAPDVDKLPGSDRGGFDTSKDPRTAHNLKFWAVQCESCHGPGSAHVRSGGNRNLINRVPIARETCWGCHATWPHEKGFPPTEPVKDERLVLMSSSFVRSHNPGVLIAGTGGYEYPGYNYKHTPHIYIANTCQTCHAFSKPGSPTWSHESVHPKKELCAKCHGGAASAPDLGHVVVNRAGNTLKEIQQHIRQLLIELGGATATGDPDRTAGGGALRAYQNAHGQDIKWRRARWNHSIVLNDLSLGAHDYQYAKGLLESALADLRN